MAPGGREYVEDEKAFRNLMLYGVSFIQNGKCIDPWDVIITVKQVAIDKIKRQPFFK